MAILVDALIGAFIGAGISVLLGIESDGFQSLFVFVGGLVGGFRSMAKHGL